MQEGVAAGGIPFLDVGSQKRRREAAKRVAHSLVVAPFAAAERGVDGAQQREQVRLAIAIAERRQREASSATIASAGSSRTASSALSRSCRALHTKSGLPTCSMKT